MSKKLVVSESITPSATLVISYRRLQQGPQVFPINEDTSIVVKIEADNVVVDVVPAGTTV